MQFISNGPDIPVEVIQALEEENLLLFCGAGISRPAGLPSFKGLVKGVYKDYGSAWEMEEKREFDSENYDRTLGLLEMPGRLGSRRVRQSVYRQLQPEDDPDLRTHQALLDLASTRDKKLRLVTTNFDHLFELVDNSLNFASAPLLPVPKPYKWSGLVYLHGRLGEQEDENSNLVLTSADFGLAYLAERWASRFVSMLFTHYTVLFVGYSVGDPVLRYMVDAFAAERRMNEEIEDAYAFAPYSEEEGNKNEVANRWEAKGLQPILYEESDGHHLLHETIREWARIWRGGLRSRQNIAKDVGQKDPESVEPKDVELLTWAVSEPSGTIARTFAEQGKNAPIGWLPKLDEAGLLGDVSEIESNPPIAASRSLRNERMGLTQVARFLSRWLVHYLDKPKLVEWVLQQGGHLHPEVTTLIRGRLDDSEVAVPDAFQRVWRVLTSPEALLYSRGAPDSFSVYGRVGKEPWNPSLRSDFLSRLHPCLDLSPAVSFSFAEFLEDDGVPEGANEERQISVHDLLQSECETRAGQFTRTLIDRARDRDDWPAILQDIGVDIVFLLRKALSLFQMLEQADEYSDPSYIQHPSIAPHDQNNFFAGWTHLIDLAREAIDEADGDSVLCSLVWFSREFALFRRLTLYGFTQNGEPSIDRLLYEFTEHPRLWIWANPLQVEFFSALPVLWEVCSADQKVEFEALILQGPPRAMYRDGLDSEAWERIRDRTRWERLVRIQATESGLQDEAARLLDEIEDRHEGWQYRGEDREDFPLWSETRWGFEKDLDLEELEALEDKKIEDWLLTKNANREGPLKTWQQFASRHPERTVNILTLIEERESGCSDVWGAALRGLSESDIEANELSATLGLIDQLSDETLNSSIYPLARFIRHVAPIASKAHRAQLLSLWDRVLPLSTEKEAMDDENRVTVALNHPSGILTEALLKLFRADLSAERTELATDIRERLGKLTQFAGEAGKVARTIIASRLSLFHFVDQEWAEDQVVPLLDWQDVEEVEDPKGAWQGYLWEANINPSLWSAIKPSYFGALDHIELFTSSNVRNLAQLLAIASIEYGEGVTPDETRQGLRALGDAGRAEVGRWLRSKLEGAGDRAAGLWTEQLGPWIQESWPQEEEHRGPHASDALGHAVIHAQNAFPNAVEDIKNFLVPVEHGGPIIMDLMKEGHPQSYPEATIELLSRILGDDPPPYYTKVGECLRLTEEAMPEIGENLRFIRLKDIAIRKGWLE